MSNQNTQRYRYNPHHHVKIWFSNKPDVFLNDENQLRLIKMRDKNPDDCISLVFDSSVLTHNALLDLKNFCSEHEIIPVDADQLENSLKSENEKKLYEYYKDEMTHLSDGGSLAVASDIIRWISSVYRLGTYTDFDVTVDTSQLPPTLLVDTPLLLNIGSLKIKKKEIVLSNNDCIAVVDPIAAKGKIEEIQNGFLSVLSIYTNDFIDKTEQAFRQGGFLFRFVNMYLLNFLRNRSEAFYIARSKSIFPTSNPQSSRQLRAFINQVMTNYEKYLNFNKISPEETDKSVIQRLRKNIKRQRGIIKWLFFRNEYSEIKKILALSDRELITGFMKKEYSLYLRSIVVCTTGPIAIAKSLFKDYFFDTKYFYEKIQPFSFYNYDLTKAFLSKNSIPLHENVLRMLYFLGAGEGELNDSSWLEEGARLQETRDKIIAERRKVLQLTLPNILEELKKDLVWHIKKIEDDSKTYWTFIGAVQREVKINALRDTLACFRVTPPNVFDIREFKKVLRTKKLTKNGFSGLFYNETQKLIKKLEHYSYEALFYGLTKNHKIQSEEGAESIFRKPTENTTSENIFAPVGDVPDTVHLAICSSKAGGIERLVPGNSHPVDNTGN
ncbi:hypothetical protein TUM19329_07730 [Legionella antarctica]|uniref:Lgt1 glycosyltransferase domain-containing protein n=1 Tax=Legionella antarctica TaxID=2708020 RepID=A0A6F8T317_9GAMM|nr:glycosyltransferase family 88 protein [Legionella antarctica]BCA94412.1 hypothetical protein TUM19329_07730 [Legionella antarctica]